MAKSIHQSLPGGGSTYRGPLLAIVVDVPSSAEAPVDLIQTVEPAPEPALRLSTAAVAVSAAGAYNRHFFSSTCAVSNTKYTLNTPWHTSTPPKYLFDTSLTAPPTPQKALTLSRTVDQFEPLVSGGAVSLGGSGRSGEARDVGGD
jgi:hypothetical protein